MSDIAPIITSISGLITASALAVSVLRNSKGIKAIDRAVNTKPPGQQTISQQVEQLASRLPAQDAAAKRVLEQEEKNVQ